MSGARKATSASGPLNEDPRWAEALARLVAGDSIRAIAVAFETTPRRLRRALARSGVRAGGTMLDRNGVTALAPFRNRLGREPDSTVARAAGVTPEAVQGERLRLGIPPFRPAPTVKLTDAERSWIEGVDNPDAPPTPGPVRRPRRDSTAVVIPVVVKKPGRDGASSVRRLVRPDAPPVEESPRPYLARGVLAFRANEPIVPAQVQTDPPPPPPAPFMTDWREERRQELEKLIQGPQRPRSDRMRIVRADAPILEASPAPSIAAAPVRRTRLPTWRAPDPALLQAMAAEAEAEAARVEAAAARAEAQREEAAKLEAERAEAAWAEAQRIQAAREEARRAEAQRAGEARALAAAESLARAQAAAGAAWSEAPAWAVHAEGLNEIVYVLAHDLVSAIAAAQAVLPAGRFPIVAIEAA